MNLIVAVSAKDWGIGCENALLFHIPEDMKYFRATTKGKVVVMGHSTFKSLPGGKPLKYRTNIVLSRDTSLSIPDVIVCNSMDALFAQLKNYDTNDVFVIGGAVIYAELLSHCQKAYITKIDAALPADTFFPNIDVMPNWTLTEASEVKEYEGIQFQFCVYENMAQTL
ncbi:MAG: dihydrofolate reductase [Defluviitaleaceae bacterium]|nr:dihydrofolate reductase [Defluviitaleaceae bacterium]